jgi:hypothetical protein
MKDYKETVIKQSDEKVGKRIVEVKESLKRGHVPDYLKKVIRERLG